MPVDNTDAIDESSRKFMDLWKKMYPDEQDPALPPLDTSTKVKEPDGKIAPIRVRDDAKDEKELETAKSGSAAAPAADVPSTQTDSESADAPKPALTPEQKFMTLPAAKAPVPGMPAAGEPDWKQLQANLEGAQNRANWTRIQDKSFATNMPAGTVHVDEHAGENDIAAARAPLEIAQARQKYGLEQAQLEDTKAQAEQRKAATGLGAAERDANSPQSQKARDALKTFFKGTELPAGFDTWSAADVKQYTAGDLLPLSKMKLTQDIANEKAKGALDSVTAQKEGLKRAFHTGDATADAATDAEIDGLRDQPGINTYAQVHSKQLGEAATDKRAQAAQEHSDQAAETARKGALQNGILLKQWEMDNPAPKVMGDEMLKNLATAKTAGDQLKSFSDYLDKNRSEASKFGAWASAHGAVGDIAAAFGAPGTDFDGFRTATISELTRQIDNSAARAQAVEQLKGTLPLLTDTPDVQKAKMAHVQTLVDSNFANLVGAAKKAGYRTKGFDENKPAETPAAPTDKGNGKVVKETARVRTYENGFKELK